MDVTVPGDDADVESPLVYVQRVSNTSPQLFYAQWIARDWIKVDNNRFPKSFALKVRTYQYTLTDGVWTRLQESMQVQRNADINPFVSIGNVELTLEVET